MKKPAKKTTLVISLFISLVFVFLSIGFNASADCSKCPNPADQKATTICQDNECVRKLEITYPTFPGEPVPKTVQEGIPNYVKYIFNLSIVVIGLIIFSVLVLNGVKYLASTGDPAKFSDAKEGILSGFLGAIILISAVIIFNSINPQLTIFQPPEFQVFEANLWPGVYICNYKVSRIDDVMRRFLQRGVDEPTIKSQIKAAKELKKIMKDGDKACYRTRASSRIRDFVFKKEYTIFIIPDKKFINTGGAAGEYDFEWDYKYGAVLHKDNDFKGRCKIFPRIAGANNFIYQTTSGTERTDYPYSFSVADLDFDVRSVTIFEKPDKEPSPSASYGATLYACFRHNKICPEIVTDEYEPPKDPPYERYKSPGADDIYEVGKEGLGELLPPDASKPKVDSGPDAGKKKVGTRSIWMLDDPKVFLAVLFDDDDFGKGAGAKDCEVIKDYRSDLAKTSLGACGPQCDFILSRRINPIITIGDAFTKQNCGACLRSMLVIKGEAL